MTNTSENAKEIAVPKPKMMTCREFVVFRKKFGDVEVKSLVSKNCERGMYLKKENKYSTSPRQRPLECTLRIG